MLSVHAIAAALGGRVVRDRKVYVAAPYPGSKKKRDRSLHVFINGDDIGVHVFREGVDAVTVKDYVRAKCGLPAWQPKPKRKPKPEVPFEIRNHFVGETLAVCRLRRQIAPEHLALLINDVRLRGDAIEATKYIREFGFGPADLERCMATKPRHYNADERATILNLTYAERQHLGLRRTGSIDVDKVGRERARRDRGNAAKRAKRAAARLDGVNKRYPVEGRPSRNQKEEEYSTSVVERETNPEVKTWSTPDRDGRLPCSARFKSSTVLVLAVARVKSATGVAFAGRPSMFPQWGNLSDRESAGAKRRLADEYDAAQERGEVASQGKPSRTEGLAKTEDLGLTRKDIHEARNIRGSLNAHGPPTRDKRVGGRTHTRGAMRMAQVQSHSDHRIFVSALP